MEVILVTAIRKERPTLLTAAVDGRTAITRVEGAPDFKRQLVVRLRKQPGRKFKGLSCGSDAFPVLFCADYLIADGLAIDAINVKSLPDRMK